MKFDFLLHLVSNEPVFTSSDLKGGPVSTARPQQQLVPPEGRKSDSESLITDQTESLRPGILSRWARIPYGRSPESPSQFHAETL